MPIADSQYRIEQLVFCLFSLTPEMDTGLDLSLCSNCFGSVGLTPVVLVPNCKMNGSYLEVVAHFYQG